MLNKHDSVAAERYQVLGDIIRIFWEVHKIRISRDEIPLTISNKPEGGAFDPKYAVQLWKTYLKYTKPKVMNLFVDAVKSPLRISWYQFVRAIKENSLPGYEVFTQDQYVKDLFQRAELLGEQLRQNDPRRPTSAEFVIQAGFHTGIEITSHLAMLFDRLFEPTMVSILSKVNLENVNELQGSVGLSQEESPTYEAIDLASTTKLNLAVLRGLGLGDAVGCPAGLATSTETVAFLKRVLPQVGINDPEIKGTMLKEFATFISEIYRKQFKDWFDTLTEAQRELWIDEGEKALAEGQVLKSLERQSTEGGLLSSPTSCPYHSKES
jgi:hypothetical protein